MFGLRTLLAAIELVSPTNGSVVVLLPECQRQVLKAETLSERERTLMAIKKASSRHAFEKGWRKSADVRVEWSVSEGETGPWEIELSKSPEFEKPLSFIYRCKKTDVATGRTVSVEERRSRYAYLLPLPNLEVATRYYWRVSSNITCGKFGHGRKCDCKDRRPVRVSSVGIFVTEDLAPRWISTEGRVGNFRDLGGRIGFGGHRVRQGLVFRSQGLNENSRDGEVPGPNRMMVEDVKLLVEKFGIRTELDLRSRGETAGLSISPLGNGVHYVNNPSYSYQGIFSKDGKSKMARNFRLFCDHSNYPILFHCIGGADRTGSLAYVLNGALGVARREIETDWESTFYPRIPNYEKGGKLVWNSEQHFNNGFARYGRADASWNERIVLYLKDCGITDGEIEKFRSIMLEEM